MNPDDLERLIDRHLRTLPGPKAPRSLVPRVMAALTSRPAAPWYRRGWAAWPATWQLTSLAAFVVLSCGIVVAWPYLADWLASMPVSVQAEPASLVPAPVSVVMSVLSRTWDASHVLWRVLVQPIIGYVVAFVLTMFLACVAFGTAFDRVALGGPSEL